MRGYQDASEDAPDRYIRYEYPALLDASREAAAAHLGVPTDDVVVVSNVTTAINAVLRNLAPSFRDGDVILYVDTTYGSILKTIEYAGEISPVQSVRVEFELPASDEQVLDAFRGAFAAHRGQVRLAVFDTIASLPAVRLPFEEMQSISRAEGALTLVDGARMCFFFLLACRLSFLSRVYMSKLIVSLTRWHGTFPARPQDSRPRLLHDQLPQVSIGVGPRPRSNSSGSIEVSAWLTFRNRWLYTPRGCAVFYVPLRNQHLMRSSLPTSHWFEPVPRPGKQPTPNPLPPSTKSNFVQQFEFVGTVDNASLLCIPAALKFREEICGGEEASKLNPSGHSDSVRFVQRMDLLTPWSRICKVKMLTQVLSLAVMRYCWDLAAAGGAAASRILGTEVMDNTAGSLTRECAMVMVRLPVEPHHGLEAAAAAKIGARVQSWMCEEMAIKFNTFMAITFYKGRWWARFSAQIYLDVSDFEWGAGVLARLCAQAPADLGHELFQDGTWQVDHTNEASKQRKGT